jgi:hypothetical protein
MTKLYVVGHGGTGNGGTVFVPTGRFVHCYAKPGEALSAFVVQTILAAGGSETGLLVHKPRQPIFNWSFAPDRSDDLQRDLTSLAQNMDGKVLFVKGDLELCTTPEKCREPWLKWRREKQEKTTSDKKDTGKSAAVYHHEDCAGLFNAYPNYKEIHLLVCQVFSGLESSNSIVTVPKLARDNQGAVRRDAKGGPLIELDDTAHHKYRKIVTELMRRGKHDPVETLTYLHNVVSPEDLAILRSIGGFARWLDGLWDDYQQLAPWNYEHDPKDARSKLEQYQDETKERKNVGWLKPEFRKKFADDIPPASFVDCMKSTWDEVFFTWLSADWLKVSSNQLYEWVYFTWDMAVRWDNRTASTDQVIELIRTHDIGTLIPQAAEIIDRLEVAIQRWRHASTGGHAVGEDQRVGDQESITECMTELLDACETWMSDLYDNEFLPAVNTALTS